MPSDRTASAQPARSWRWPTAIVTILCLHATAMVVVIFVATRDPSFAVEPNSYKQAVSWDSSQARRLASEQLGWAAAISTDPTADERGHRRVRCQLKDKHGVPVLAATVHLEVFHHARATERVQVTLEPAEHGFYSASIPMKRAGTWEIRVTARRGQEVFSSTLTQDVEGHS